MISIALFFIVSYYIFHYIFYDRNKIFENTRHDLGSNPDKKNLQELFFEDQPQYSHTQF